MIAEPLFPASKDLLPFGASELPVERCAFWTQADGKICVQHDSSPRSAFYRPHSHCEYGIVVCLAGEVFMQQLGSTNVIGPGEALISNSGVEHASGYVAGSKGYSVVCVTVENRAISRLLGRFRLPEISADRAPVFNGKLQSRILQTCAADIAFELLHRDLGCEIVMKSLATRILVETLRAWPRSQVCHQEIDLTPRLPRRDFMRAYEFMRGCRKDAFRVQHLCHFLGTSEERFTRLFLKSARTTPASFYNQLLMERSLELLKDSSLSVKEISFELGFKTSSHFIVNFRRQFGRTPHDYRLKRADAAV